VIDLPTAATFSAVVADPRFALALGVFVALIFAVTLVKGPGVLVRPL